MKRLSFILFSGLIFFSCKKSSDYYDITVTVLDWDSQQPVPGAKVYLYPVPSGPYVSTATDSGLTDNNGKIVLTVKKQSENFYVSATKANYLQPPMFYPTYSYANRAVTLFLARPSIINLTLHKSGTWLASDTVDVKFQAVDPVSSLTSYTRKANSPDTILNLYTVYATPYYTKFRVQWDMIRNNSVISTNKDSIPLIQFGTVNYTLNY